MIVARLQTSMHTHVTLGPIHILTLKYLLCPVKKLVSQIELQTAKQIEKLRTI